ncbi:SGNH/GDSL hydrolase family protein [Williamsia deligens]|uniref:SGNH/GDSL hydrolase family protein n=1 Tax=Williamsia deligens TaxID=321325 RepID=A0ABW3G8X8_9NOCA|nr:SGNH/GDSL hydrolase family protein [Williamsia deligens]MCP2192311.1 Lysophospholipase L1 [Williamsia deligens]
MATVTAYTAAQTDALLDAAAQEAAKNSHRWVARPKIAAMGDSITAANHLLNQPYSVGGGAWMDLGTLLSGYRYEFVGAASTGGYTIAQVLATHLPTVLAAQPDYCLVLAGQNDIGAIDTPRLTMLRTIWEALIAAGITPILCTNVPSSTIPNWWLLYDFTVGYAHQHSLPLFDLHAVLTDPATGLYRAGYSTDAVHPNTKAGIAAAAQAWSAFANNLVGTAPQPPTQLLPITGSDGGTTPNPLMSGSSTTALPDGWYWAEAAASGTVALEAATYGNRMRLTKSSSQRLQANSPLTPVQPSTRYAVTMRIGAHVAAQGANWSLTVVEAPSYTAPAQFSAVEVDVPDGTLAKMEFTTSAAAQQILVAAAMYPPSGGAGANLAIEQYRVRQLSFGV